VSFDGVAESHLFGSKESCNGLAVGDGVINGYDLVVLMWAQFRVAPYGDLELTHPTVSIHEDPGIRCDDDVSRNAYVAMYDPSTPCVHPRRRLLGKESAPSLTIHRHVTMHGRGSWFQLRSHGSPYAAMEVQLGGVHATTTVALSNDRAPLNSSDIPKGYEVRFARHEEYCNRASTVKNVDTVRCANVRGIVSTGVALYHNVLGLGQIPTLERSDVCSYDIFLYVPGVFDCSVDILAGSSFTDGKDGHSIGHTVVCDEAPIFTCDATNDARGDRYETFYDTPSNEGTANVDIVIATILGALLLSLIALAMWILRNQRVALRKAPAIKDSTNVEESA
jgi:hypothetical protein